MAVTPLPAPDDHTAPDPKKSPDLALVTGQKNKPQADESAETGEPAAPPQDAEHSPTSEQTGAAGTPRRSTLALAQTTSDDEPRNAVTRPRLAAVRGGDEHFVPATARYARELTDSALALRHQAIVRLGVASETTPATRSADAAPASDTDQPAAAHQVGSGRVGRRVVREELPGLPDARMWGGRLAQAVSEVLAGDRPISQLVRFTDDQVFLELNRRVRLLGLNSTAVTRGAKEKSTVRSVRVFMPESSIAEVAAHIRHGGRSRAVALRLEIRRNRWVCTALELG